MIEKRNFDILDYLLLISRKKKLLIILAISIFIVSYLSVYFFIPPQFDSTALIVTSESDQVGGLASLMKSFSNLPVSIPGLKSSTDTDVFTTIIFSRTNLENIISKFNLYKEYGNDTMEKTIKELEDNIKADETKQGAYSITVRNKSPKKAADMVNYIVEQLNKTLIDLNISKSSDNRLFLEKRYQDIKASLKLAEDSLVLYQKESGILQVESQAKVSFEAYSRLEADLASKQIEYSIISKLYGVTSPQAVTANISVKEYENKLNEIKNGKNNSGFILPLKNLPKNSMQYLRLFRDVTIYNKMLEFIIPLYEQSRFEEQKNIPILKVIDRGIPAEKKAFPPRTLLSLILTFGFLLIILFVMIIREKILFTNNPKVLLIKQNISFRNKNKS
jgi:tyrosine-protein kinase Etk/Wzc